MEFVYSINTILLLDLLYIETVEEVFLKYFTNNLNIFYFSLIKYFQNTEYVGFIYH